MLASSVWLMLSGLIPPLRTNETDRIPEHAPPDYSQVDGINIPDSVTLAEIAGDYMKEGVGLVLRSDGSFEAALSGCCGTYGTASGSWLLEGNRITLTTSSASGLMKGDLRNLDIVRFYGGRIVVSNEWFCAIVRAWPVEILLFRA
ncbi:MAG TPA: hypothetical protein VGM03_10360 [Phycisphaerae bacterium]